MFAMSLRVCDQIFILLQVCTQFSCSVISYCLIAVEPEASSAPRNASTVLMASWYEKHLLAKLQEIISVEIKSYLMISLRSCQL